jgi:hypothetical protein
MKTPKRFAVLGVLACLILGVDCFLIVALSSSKSVALSHLFSPDALLFTAAVQIFSLRALLYRLGHSLLSKYLCFGASFGLLIGPFLGLILMFFDYTSPSGPWERKLNLMGITIASEITCCVGLLVGVLGYWLARVIRNPDIVSESALGRSPQEK